MQKLLAAAQVCIAHHVQIQCLCITQGAIKGRHHIGHHPFLHCSNAIEAYACCALLNACISVSGDGMGARCRYSIKAFSSI